MTLHAHLRQRSPSKPFFRWIILLGLLLVADVGLHADRNPFGGKKAKLHSPRARSYDVQHYRITIEPDLEKGTLEGSVTISLLPLHPNFRIVELDAADLEILRCELTLSEPFAKAQGKLRESKGQPLPFRTEKRKLLIDLGNRYDPPQQIDVTVWYRGRPNKGMYFIRPDEGYPEKPPMIWTQGQPQETRYWLPCYDFPNDRATSELICIVPRGNFALSNGQLVDVSPSDTTGKVSYHWKQSVPHVSYLLSVVAGQFDEFHEEAEGIPLFVYVPRGLHDAETVERSFRHTADMLRYFQEVIGLPYPYEKYAQVTVDEFVSSGMENTSATTLTRRTLHDERAHLDVRSEDLVAHELAHQWWGDLVTANDWAHIWLNEGFASYFETLYAERLLGPDDFKRDMQGLADWYFGEDRGYRRPVVCSVYRSLGDLFDGHTYAKGAWILHMLRFHVGEELFWKGIRAYIQKHARQVVDTHDFRRAMEEATGKDLSAFFEQWAFKAGYPKLRFSWSWDEGTKLLKLHVEQTQKVTKKTPLFSFPVAVEVVEDEARTTYRLLVEQKDQWIYLPVATKPKVVAFDKDGWILAKIDLRSVEKSALIEQARRDSDSLGRSRAVEALAPGTTEDAETLGALGEILLADPFYAVRKAAARVLGATKASKALETLLQAAADPESRVRQEVADALGNFPKEDSATEALVKLLETDPSYYVRASAARSLGKTGSKKAFELLSAHLEEPSHQDVLRKSILDALSEMPDRNVKEVVFNYARYGNSEDTRDHAVRMLGRLGKGDDDVLGFLSDLLGVPRRDARSAALSALGELGDRRAIDAIEKWRSTLPSGSLKRRAERVIRSLREEPGERKAKALRKEARELAGAIRRKARGAAQRNLEADELRLKRRKILLELGRLPKKTRPARRQKPVSPESPQEQPSASSPSGTEPGR